MTITLNSILVLTLALLLAASSGDGLKVELKHLSTVYLPHSFDGEVPEYEFDSDAVEQAVFEPTGKIIYAVGEQLIHIIDASDPLSLSYLNHVTVADAELTDVEVCEDAIFVSYINTTDLLHGGVLQYQLYSRQSGAAAFVRNIGIGTQPDMVLATTSCTLVVALENPGIDVDGQLQDPPGGVGIIQFPEGVTNAPDVTTLDFTAFNNRSEDLKRSGVRWVYQGSGNQFSDDLEPEYVTFNADQTKAYVGLQDNNAIAVVDLTTKTITDIYGLGFKDWTQYNLDPSDKDNGIHMASWPVYGIYQPDNIKWFRWSGTDYIITANEGDNKEYDVVNFEEDTRGSDFTASQLSSSVTQEMREALQNEAKLGRLQLSTVDGKDAEGKFERFYTFGGRSFSIWRASDMVQVYDSGSALSMKTVELRGDFFNNNIKDKDGTVAEGTDKRSDNRGPEPESIALAEVRDNLLIFVGSEKPGSISVYSVDPGNEPQPQFQSLYTDGIPRGNSTWGQMYDERLLHAVDPESISYIPEESGLADYPLLLVTGTVSGTVSFLKVEISGAPSGMYSTNGGSFLLTVASSLLLMLNVV